MCAFSAIRLDRIRLVRPRGFRLSIIVMVAAAVTVGACSSSSKKVQAPTSTTAPAAARTLLETAAYDRDLPTFATAANAAGLATKLTGKSPYTIFAPLSGAFAALGSRRVRTLLSPAAKQQLASILAYHVVRGRLRESDLKNGPLETLNGATIAVSHDGDNVVLTGAKGTHATIVRTDVNASNGVIHVIDGVLEPPK
jgi:uncharacterized surface protein with fasciclin (FAS1) repeats